MRVVVSEFVSLDGVAQAPGGPEEDTSGGFRHGGWSMPFFDPEVIGPVIGELAHRSEALLQGRRTFQVSSLAWPERDGDPFADWINSVQKYVVSDTLSEPDLSWQPTAIIRGAELLIRPANDGFLFDSQRSIANGPIMSTSCPSRLSAITMALMCTDSGSSPWVRW